VVTPALIAIVLATGLLALVPTWRLAKRSTSLGVVASWYVATWVLLAGLVVVPGLARIAIPLLVVLAIAPWIDVRAGIDRLLGRPARVRRPPPRNVTPPDAGGPWSP
jgi:hypothetical protein